MKIVHKTQLYTIQHIQFDNSPLHIHAIWTTKFTLICPRNSVLHRFFAYPKDKIEYIRK